MPGLILFRRRWAIAADDLVIPSAFLMATHTVWATVELMTFIFIYHTRDDCSQQLQVHTMGYFAMMCIAVILEVCIGWITMRGAIMNTRARRTVKPFLYARCVLFLLECGWMLFGIVWLSRCYLDYRMPFPKAVLLGIIIFNGIMLLVILTGVYLSYDLGGGKWLKLRKYEANIQTTGSKLHHGSNHRTWRTRQAVRAYQTSWNRRCRLLFCCLSTGQRTSLVEIAQLLSDFFRDLDLVPSDIVAGLILLRRYQRLRRHALLAQNKPSTYQFLSGVPINQHTKFLKLTNQTVLKEYKQLIRYMRFSLAVYGWPMYVLRGNMCCKLLNVVPGLRCMCCFWLPQRMPGIDVLDDNCCMCNSSAMWAVMETVATDESIQFVHASYTGGVGVTPYFLALDHLERKIVVTIRGTMSMKDLVTDLNADAEFIPVNPLQTNPPWLAHKGMISAAEYVQKKLIEDGKLKQLIELSKARTGTPYDLMLVGHSLGAGTAAILAIMLKPDFPTLKCICFSPPGGLLNLPAAEYTRPFVTTCLLGKDLVTRLGIHQLEAMRSDLLNVIQRSTCPKWKTLMTSVFGCLFPVAKTDPAIQKYAVEQAANMSQGRKAVSPYMTTHPPMYLPGKIIHIVRRYPNQTQFCCKRSERKGEPVYQAIEAERETFYEINLSPSMIDDHMPDTLLAAMEKVLENTAAPPKPKRMSNGANSFDLDSSSVEEEDSMPIPRILQPGSGLTEAPFAFDLNLPFVDLNMSPSPTSEYSESIPRLSVSGGSSRQNIPISAECLQTRSPQVRIYTCLVDEGTSCYNLESPDSGNTSDMISTKTGKSLSTQHSAPVYWETGDAAAPNAGSRVTKAKSLNELPGLINKRSQLLPSNTTKTDKVSGRKARARHSTSGSNLQIPTENQGYNYAGRQRSSSQETLSDGSYQLAAQIQLMQEIKSSDGHSSVVSTPRSTRSVDRSFSNDKTQYGTIYYV